jgi:hypothetical protein
MDHYSDPVTNWIKQAPHAEGIRWWPVDREVFVDTPSIEAADYLMAALESQPHPFTIAQKCVVIRCNGRIYGTSSRACKLQECSNRRNDVGNFTQIDDQMLSDWVRNNPQLFAAIPGCAIIYRADRDADYPCTEVKFEFSEKQLNKPRIELIGRGLSAWDEAIAIPRRAAIERLMESGEPQTIVYENLYKDLIWVLKSRVALLPNNEIFVSVVEGDGWQRDYWKRIAEQENRVSAN